MTLEIASPYASRRYDLAGPELLLPFAIAGAAAGGTAVVASWLGANWDTGTYNTIVKQTDNTIAAWDKLGWSSGCWAKHPQKRAEWLSFWKLWSQHYGKYGQQSGYLSDSAEMPVRNLFLPQLALWGDWLNKTCAAGIDLPTPHDPPDSETDWGAVAKWGAISLGALVALNVVMTLRSSFSQRP